MQQTVQQHLQESDLILTSTVSDKDSSCGMDTWQFIFVLMFAVQRMAYYCSACDSLHR